MPITELHKKQKSKNMAVLAALVAFIVLMFAVTIVRMAVR